MEYADYEYLCRIYSELSGVPTRLYKNEELFKSYAVIKLPRDPLAACFEEVMGIKEHVGYYISSRFHLYGVVNSGEYKIVIGPTAQIMAGESSLRELAFTIDVPKEEAQAFLDGMNQITRLPFENLLMMLCTFNFVANGEKLTTQDIAISHADQEFIKSSLESKRTEDIYETDRGMFHHAVEQEEALMEMIRKGDTESLRQWLAAAPAISAGILASDQLRQLRNLFIVVATLASRAAIRGGLNSEDAFSLSDMYIRKVECLTQQSSIMNLEYNMIIEFTEQVEKIRHGKNPTKLAVDVANYVHRHLSETISTEKMAKEFFLSRTHFSAKFKKETGMTLTDFILKEKTEEAKRLLRYSDKSAASIGAYLGFSSHSHFCKVFKKYANMTPDEYRKKYF